MVDTGFDARIHDLLMARDFAAAATEALRRLGPPVLRYMRFVLREDAAAADAFSQWAENFWKGLPSFRGHCSLRTWALRLAHNVVLNQRDEHWPLGWEPFLRPGLVVGRFELLREIARGGFGVVYEARDRELGRTVAFKALRGSLRPKALEERLLFEAEAAARCSHPNIVTLFDFGRTEQGPYLVLELLHGETLAERLRRGPIAAKRHCASRSTSRRDSHTPIHKE